MPQATDSRGPGYEMPSAIVGSLVHRSTWQLYCRRCDRRVYPNVIDLIQQHAERKGEIPEGYFYDRAKCGQCGGRFAVNGIYVYHLQRHGDLDTLVVTDGSSWRRPTFTPYI